MAEPPRLPDADADDDSGLDPGGGQARGTPRWMIVVGIIIAIAAVALMVLLHLTGAFGPGVH
jgi:hypothetical protein